MKFLFTVFLYCFLVGRVHSMDTQIIHVGETPHLFKSWHKVNDKYSLLMSKPVYNEQDTDTLTKGFNFPKKKVIKGEFSREIYDYSPSQSALNVFKQVKKSLLASGYKSLFFCTIDGCGDVAAWQLYFSNLIGESSEQQYFVSAVKSVALGQKEYVSLYINEIENQPRMLIDIIKKPEHEKFDIVVKSSEFARNIEKDGRVIIDGIYFDLGSAILKNTSKNSLKNMATILKKYATLKFCIVGHTDNTGTFQRNMELSKQRAQAVRTILINNYHVSPKQLIASGVGLLSPLTSNKDDSGRALNRRVELVQL